MEKKPFVTKEQLDEITLSISMMRRGSVKI